MKKGYLYLIFLALGMLVVLLITVIFKVSGATDTIIATGIEDEKNSQNINLFGQVEDLANSWVNKIPIKKNQKEYHYPVQTFSVEFNKN